MTEHGRRLAIEPDERGDLAVAPLALRLGLRPTRYRQYNQRFVRWIAADGNPLPMANERAEQERARADEAVRRVEELERRLRESSG